MPQFIAPTKPQNRLESDREVLNFPEGGVHGKAERTRGDHVDTLRLAQGLELTLDDMQARLDELADEVDRVLEFPGAGEDEWPAPAA